MTMQETVRRNSLRYTTGRAISCPICGSILDCKNALETTLMDAKGSVLSVSIHCGGCAEKREIVRVLKYQLSTGKLPAVASVEFATWNGIETWKREIQ
jgi:hypothetical protein